MPQNDIQAYELLLQIQNRIANLRNLAKCNQWNYVQEHLVNVFEDLNTFDEYVDTKHLED